MAASITGTASGGANGVGTGGKIVTITLSGGTGTGYGPASGITGLKIYKSGTGGELYHQVSQAISGAILTVTLDTIVPSGVTAQFDIGTSATCNITDSGANTPTGQTTVAVTNNSTQTPTATFRNNSANISTAAVDLSGVAALLGKTEFSNVSPGSRWEFTFTGTDLDMEGYTGGPTAPFDIVIDGGGSVAPTVTATNAFAKLPIFSGLSNTAHTVAITYKAQWYVRDDVTFTGYGTGTVALPTGYGKSYLLKVANAFIEVPPPWGQLTDGLNNPGAYLADADQVIGFKTTGGSGNPVYRLQFVQPLSNIVSNLMLKPDGSVWLYTPQSTGAQMVLITNGVEGGSLSPAFGSSAVSRWVQIFTGLDGTSIDESYVFPVRKSFHFGGDSITFGEAGPAQTDTRQGFVHLAGKSSLNIAVANGGANGAAMPSTHPLLASYQQPTACCLDWGTIQVSNSTPQATATTTCTSLLNDTRTKFPTTKILFMKTLPRGDAFAASVATYNGYWHTAITNVADANTIECDVSRGLDPTTGGVHTSDGLHSNAVACAIINNNWLPYLLSAYTSAYSISLGAASGPAGTPVNVTVTRGAGTWTTGEIISLSDSAGGSFSTLTLTPGQTVATCTYTPSTAGAKTVAPTNSQNWVNPAGAAFTASAASTSLPRVGRMSGIRGSGKQNLGRGINN